MIRIGIIGCGWIMRSTYAPALLSLMEDFEVAAVCDLNETLARELSASFAGAEVFTDARAMLTAGKIDAALALTSEKVNAVMARMVLEQGLPVYLEKPPAVRSAQLDELIAAEARSRSFIYTAFNRRHTPLFALLDFGGEKIVMVGGALRRKGRVVKTFPHTAIHLIDSAQYFARSPFANWEINFDPQPIHSAWTISGTLESGVEVALDFVPDGDQFAEYLVLHSKNKGWKLEFPNADGAVPEGEIIVTARDGAPLTRTKGDASLPSFAAMGFRSCLLDFAACVREKKASPVHRLPSCRPTIRVMEEMEALVAQHFR